MIFGQDVGNGFAPFDDGDVVFFFDGFFEVLFHDAWVAEAIKIIVGESFAIWASISFGNRKTRTSDRLFDTEPLCKATDKSSLAGADITNKLDDTRRVFGKIFAKFKHFLLRINFHYIIIA